MVTASIAGTHLSTGGLQCGSPLAQDLRLIQTRPEKSVGCDYIGSKVCSNSEVIHSSGLSFPQVEALNNLKFTSGWNRKYRLIFFGQPCHPL